MVCILSNSQTEKVQQRRLMMSRLVLHNPIFSMEPKDLIPLKCQISPHLLLMVPSGFI